ncbi:MAG: PAS domain S-box protein [Ectothiorhodospiraceae bacterium]|nr:PAS domain S-box protein [Ectothiorhodospiraceae bacterium]MCH8505048.1 PAS domain S-box protein [Ectothiorhodospiraceae bacterium]
MTDIERFTSAGTPPDQDAALLRCLLDMPGLLVVVTDSHGRIELFNRECERLTGYEAQQVIGRPMWEVAARPEHREALQNFVQNLSAGAFIEERTGLWVNRFGEPRQIHWRYGALADDRGRVRRIVAAGTPATAEPQLSHTADGQDDAPLRRLVDGLPVLAADLDRDYRIQFANLGCNDWFGLAPKAQVGKHIRDVIGRKAFAVLRPQFDQALAGRKAVYHGEVPYARGGVRFIHGTYAPRLDDHGDVTGLYILAMDLSRQHQFRKRLAAETRRGRTILANAIDGIITSDEAGTVLDFNPAAERLFGYHRSEVAGRNVSMLMPEPYQSRHEDYIRRYLETSRPHVIGVGREVTGRHKDGRNIELQLTIAEFLEDGQRRFVSFTQDIGDRKRAEREARELLARLAHSTRLSAVSELTAGLAHEVSQPLTAINAAAEAGLSLAEASEPSQATIKEALEQIHRQSQRANRVISQLHTFMRRDHPEALHPENIHAVIQNVLHLLCHELDETGVTVQLDLELTGCQCKVNKVQIEQVVFNLIRNAIDAMRETDGERRLRITTRRDRVGRACTIAVADTGPGITEADRDKLFDPFFTTKEQGLGQGLSICRSIVEAHGGRLTAANAPEEGATFLVELPLPAGQGDAQ